jgi:hypothetical protein
MFCLLPGQAAAAQDAANALPCGQIRNREAAIWNDFHPVFRVGNLTNGLF